MPPLWTASVTSGVRTAARPCALAARTTVIATNETARPAVLVGRLDRDKLLQRLSLGCALAI